MIRWSGRDGKSSARDGVAKADKAAKKTAVNKAAAHDLRRQMPLKMPVLDLTPVISHILCRPAVWPARNRASKRLYRAGLGPPPRGPIASGGRSLVGDRLDGFRQHVFRRGVDVREYLIDGRTAHRPHVQGKFLRFGEESGIGHGCIEGGDQR